MGDFDPELKEAIARILKAAQDAGKKSGIYCPNGEFARRYADMGFQMVSNETYLESQLVLMKCTDFRGERYDSSPDIHGRVVVESQRHIRACCGTGCQGSRVWSNQHGDQGEGIICIGPEIRESRRALLNLINGSLHLLNCEPVHELPGRIEPRVVCDTRDSIHV